MSLQTPPILWVRQDRHFYFRLFLLSRKASNAINKLPKDISKANTPIKTEMISNAVIRVTSSLMYFGKTDIINPGGYHPVKGTFRVTLYHNSFKLSLFKKFIALPPCSIVSYLYFYTISMFRLKFKILACLSKQVLQAKSMFRLSF